jgi:predicted transcriptional regulator
VADDDHILISLEPRHAENLLVGRKRVELRRRAMNVSIGSTVWMYAKLPVGSIIGRAIISAIHVLAPATLWKRFGTVSGISRGEFFEYFADRDEGIALELSHCRRLTHAFDLESLRRFDSGFQPPQFFTRLRHHASLLNAISGGNGRKDCLADPLRTV